MIVRQLLSIVLTAILIEVSAEGFSLIADMVAYSSALLRNLTSPYCGIAYRITGSAAAMMFRFLSSCLPTPSKITTDMKRLTKRQSSVT